MSGKPQACHVPFSALSLMTKKTARKITNLPSHRTDIDVIAGPNRYNENGLGMTTLH
jgi:hypothetical protein